MIESFTSYFKSLHSHTLSEITEHSHRSQLEVLLKTISATVDTKIKILHEPKRVEKFGAPDFEVSKAESKIGYVENKRIEENLDVVLKSDQITKYTELSDNILLTNYIEWIWIKNGKPLKRETLCYKTDIENKRAILNPEKIEAVQKLIESFFSQAPKQISDPKDLAKALAVRAKRLKDFLFIELERQQKFHREGRLLQLYDVFKQYVFHELSVEEFSDAFAQNLVYGLFLATLNTEEDVNLYNANKFIPGSFELIRELVDFLSELDKDDYEGAEWIVEEVLTILNNMNLSTISKSMFYHKEKKKDLFGETEFEFKDPFVYFYEDFLKVYDKEIRETRGVYYTPPQIVNFIVRAVDNLLVEKFGIEDGLADKDRVTVLDFATGTGTFLLEIFQRIFDEHLPKKAGNKNSLIRDHLLKNIYGFEFLISPYTIAHLKLSQFLKEQKYTMKPNERLQIYLTNTLLPVDQILKIPFLPALSQESMDAQKVKDNHVLVITGNPPYSGISKNKGIGYERITDLIEDYKMVDGEHFGERKHWLGDDYVKFIRFAQDKMEYETIYEGKNAQRIKNEKDGIVAIITNHSFLDNPTFRGMRQSLMMTFDQIYFLDLHGNAKKKEKTPDGSKDENVFDIEQGVAISIMIKMKGLEKKIFHSDYHGLRTEKYKRAMEDDLKTIDWKELKPNSPFYFFIPKDEKHRKKYEQGIGLNKIFKLFNVGIVTARDKFCTDFELAQLQKRIVEFRNENINDEEIGKKYGLKNTSTFNLHESRLKVMKLDDKQLEYYYTTFHYRPFDAKFIFYHNDIVERRIFDLMKHLLPERKNVGLIGMRHYSYDVVDYNYAFISEIPVDNRTFISNIGTCSLFPLFTFEDNKQAVNFTESFQSFLHSKYQINFTPTEILGYIYAILYSPAYRKKYAEFLKSDFPRISFTDDESIFKRLSTLGWEIVSAHLMHDPFSGDAYKIPYNHFITEEKRKLCSLMGEGDNDEVKLVEFEAYSKSYNPFGKNFAHLPLGKVRINDEKFFDLVPQSAFEFQIGGYKVLEKYLKDRKGRRLSGDEMKHYQNVCKILCFTIDKMEEVNTFTSSWI